MSETRIRHGWLYAVNNGGHPDIDVPEPYLCVKHNGRPRFVLAPGLANSHDGPHDTAQWVTLARDWGWDLRPDQILGPWNAHKPRGGAYDGTLTTTHHTEGKTVTITTGWHEHDGYTANIEIRTNNPYIARYIMRYLGTDKRTTEQHTGISTPEPGEGA